MKGNLLILMALILMSGLSAQVLTCQDIQSSVDASGNSTYDGQVVTVRAIVTHVIPNSAFYIGDSSGGPWSGLYVYHGVTSNSVAVGDDVQLIGTLDEYYNLTELTYITSCEVFSHSNPLPPALTLTTAEMAYNNPDGEQYEGVLVRLTDVQIKTAVDSYGQFKVADASNMQAMIDNGLFDIGSSFQITVNDWWFLIQGIVDYHSAAGFKVNPRNQTDMVKLDNLTNVSVQIQSANAEINTEVAVSVLTSHINPGWGVASYTSYIRIDPSKVHYNGMRYIDTMSVFMPTDSISTLGDLIKITYQSQEPITTTADSDTLIQLLFEPVSYGEALIEIGSFSYDTTPILSLRNGKVLTAIHKNIAWLNISNPTTTKNIFNPELNEELTVEYGCKSTSTGINVKAIIRIYDAQGRLVSTLVNKNISNSLGIESINWDGRDSNMRKLPIGVYYCHLEVIERATGKSEASVQPIIIKSKLK